MSLKLRPRTLALRPSRIRVVSEGDWHRGEVCLLGDWLIWEAVSSSAARNVAYERAYERARLLSSRVVQLVVSPS